MRILLVGAYPPPARAEAAETMETVRRLTAEGHEVTVLSDAASAAHHRGRRSGPGGALAVWLRARRFDGLVIQVDRHGPLAPRSPRWSRWGRTLDCAAWMAVLRGLPHTRLVLADPDAVPGAVGGRASVALWNSATEVVVTTKAGEERMEREGGCSPPRLRLRQTAPPVRLSSTEPWPDTSSWEAINETVRRRADEDRRTARRAARADDCP